MRRFNVRFFFALLSITVLFGLALVVAHRLQAGNIAGALLYQADQAEQAGQLPREARYLGRYLEFRPDDVDQRARLAKVLADPTLARTAKAQGQARFVLQQVLARDPQRHELRQLLVQLALDGRLFDLAREHLDTLLQSQPKEGKVLALQGEWFFVQGKSEPAVPWYRKAVAAAPADVTAYVKLARVLRDLDVRKKKSGYLGEREQLIEKMLTLSARNVEVVLAAAELSQDRREFPAAIEQLARGLKANPREPRLYVGLARAQEMNDQRQEALATLRRGLRALAREQQFELDWTLANLLLDSGDLKEAHGVIAQIKKDFRMPSAVSYLDARCAMQRKNWFEAATMLDKLRDRFKAVPELSLQVDLFLGTCYEHLNEPGLQLSTFERALQHDASSTAAQEGYAKALWAQGRLEEALKCYAQLANTNQAPKDMARKKIELARRLLWSQPARGQNWKLVENELQAAAALDPQAAEIPVLQAEIAFAKGAKDQAETILAAALQKQPGQIKVWIARALLAESQKDTAKATALLKEARQQAGDSVDLRLAQAHLLVRSAPKKKAPNFRPLEEARAQFSPTEQTRLLLELADLNFQLGNTAEAKRLWQQLASQPQHAENLQLRLFLFEAALREGQDAEAGALVKQIRALEGTDGLWWRYTEALRQLRLAHQGNKAAAARAEPLLKEVKLRREKWPAVILAEADLAQVKNENELAIARYRNAIQAGARYPGVYRKLVQLLFQQQRYQEAEQEIQQLKQQAPLTGDLGRLAVALSLFHRDFDSAEKMVRNQIAEDSTDYRDYLWLGQVLAAKGQISQEAEDALERAVALDNSAPEPWMALVRYLLQTDRRDLARTKIATAREKIHKTKRPLFLAQCSELLGDREQAGAQYLEALRAEPRSVLVWRQVASFHARQHNTRVAERLLRDLMNRKIEVTDQDVAWARQLLALLLAGGDDARRFPEALSLVGLQLDAKGKVVAAPGAATKTSAAERVGQAKVLTLQNRQPLRQEAIRLLENVLHQNALNPDDQFFLAQLYLQNGPQLKWWAQARELLQKVTIDSPRNSQYLAYFAQALLDHKDLLGAERAVGSLEQIEKDRQLPPGALGTVLLRAQILEAAGLQDKALILLQATVNRPDTTVENALQYTWHIGRLGRLKEAVDLCERLAQKGPQEEAYRTAVALLRGGWAVDLPPARKVVWEAQTRRVVGWLQDAARQNPRSIALRLQLADVCELQGRYDEVEKVCHEVLGIEPGHLVALNNLAWLLALRSAKGDQALVYVNRALDLYGQRPELLDTRAMTYLTLGRTGDAITDLQKAVAFDPSANRYFHLARAYLLARDAAAATASLAQANAFGLTLERLHPTEHEAYRQLLAELKN